MNKIILIFLHILLGNLYFAEISTQKLNSFNNERILKSYPK